LRATIPGDFLVEDEVADEDPEVKPLLPHMGLCSGHDLHRGGGG
jgi:hypothetical protein